MPKGVTESGCACSCNAATGAFFRCSASRRSPRSAPATSKLRSCGCSARCSKTPTTTTLGEGRPGGELRLRCSQTLPLPFPRRQPLMPVAQRVAAGKRLARVYADELADIDRAEQSYRYALGLAPADERGAVGARPRLKPGFPAWRALWRVLPACYRGNLAGVDSSPGRILWNDCRIDGNHGLSLSWTTTIRSTKARCTSCRTSTPSRKPGPSCSACTNANSRSSWAMRREPGHQSRAASAPQLGNSTRR